MAPTIGRQWRGGTEDYAALCDYCDVRYLRSQLRRQSNGRLACVGPGTNGCGAGLDEVALDKINADKMRNRRRPTKHRGGRFDSMVTTVEAIFGAALVDYWDARQNVQVSTEGLVISWTSVKLGTRFEPVDSNSVARWHPSVPELSGRPAVQVLTSSVGPALFTAAATFFGARQRPYMGIVQSLPPSDATAPGTIAWGPSVSFLEGSIAPSYDPPQVGYDTTAGPVALSIARDEVGTKSAGYLYEIDGTGPVAFRIGKAEQKSTLDAPNTQPWTHLFFYPGGALTLFVIANAPSPAQVAQFQALGRSYAVKMP